MKRFSKLQKQLYGLIDPNIGFQIHCSVYRMKSRRGSTALPRYFITLGKEVIFDYPKEFTSSILPAITENWCLGDEHTVSEMYPYYTEVSDIGSLIREYIDTQVAGLFHKQFKEDRWGLTDILKMADRRIGKERQKALAENTQNSAVQKIFAVRQGL